MVNKLFKYEIAFYFKRLLPFYIILLSVAVFSRLIQNFEVDFFVYDIIYGSSIITYVIMNFVALGAVIINAIVRFYKNLFTNQGYLSFTLPVTPTQHIFVKLLTAMLFSFITLLLMFIAFMAFTAGELFTEICKAALYLLKKFTAIAGANTFFYIFEFVLLLIVAFATTLFIYYTCITIGQLAKKNRIAAAFGVYLIFYLIEQAIGTVFMIVFSAVSLSDKLTDITNYIVNNIKTFAHIGLIGLTVSYLIGSLILFFIDRHIITKRLNLE
ncbi:MAG: hypothetical protein U0L72_05505 [Acutalibacteraceae bacterium]|nr:hypothetical protein [Acutalibacteraceae bacterium]